MSELSDLLRRAASAQRLSRERVLGPLGLSSAQYAVLTVVQDHPGVSGSDVARLERLTPPTVSVILANLERKGALSRRMSAVHGRVQEWELTSSGREWLEEARQALAPYETRVSRAASSEMLTAVRKWLLAVSELEV